MITINKGIHKIIRANGKEIELYVVSDYSFSTNQTIIVKEAATGNGGVTYSNGRTQEEIPINGTLIGFDTNDLNTKKNELVQVCDSGEVIDFISPFSSNTRSNKFFLKSVNFTVLPGRDNALTFSIELSEYRSANVQSTNVNKVQNFQADLLKQIYAEQTGNI